MENFEIENPGLVDFLQGASRWSSFAAEMLSTIAYRGELSERQLDACYRMRAKCEANAERRAAEQAARPRQSVDLGPIHKMFDTAKASGLKRLAYRAEGLVIKPASENGKNPGALYVTRDGTYLGKVHAGTFSPSRDCQPLDRDALLVIARDPSKAARDYGMRTGTCSCCGAELTNEESIRLGIGPICRSKWGL